MNATSLYVSTCRLVLQANPEDPGCWADLYRLIPYLRQSLSCTVCGNLLIEPYTPTETNCQHHVCRSCKGGKKKLKPSCSWCKNYEKYVENVQLRILLQCYKKLCEYIINSSIYRLMCKTTATGDTNIANMTDLIQEGAGFKDEFKSNSGLSKSAYSILPCIYASASTQTITQAININNDSEIGIDEDVSVAKANLSNGSSIYSVTYAGSGNKMVIKRKAMLNKGEVENCENLRLIKGSNFKRPIHRRGASKGRARGLKEEEKTNRTGVSNCTVSSNTLNNKRINVKKKKLGCRCGNATASPGKLTCCGQRCPCYVESKACLDCKCRGCRNPHTKEGQKVIRDPLDSANSKLQSPSQLQTEEGIPTRKTANLGFGKYRGDERQHTPTVQLQEPATAAVPSAPPSPSSREISLQVDSILNLDGNKVKEIGVRVEFKGEILSESGRIPVLGRDAEVKLNAVINVSNVNSKLMDDILSNPVLFTVLDYTAPSVKSESVQTAESKKKHSASPMQVVKTSSYNILGSCNLDIGSLATGDKLIKKTLLVEPDNKETPFEVRTWAKLPKLDVTACSGDLPLTVDHNEKFNNAVGITIESIYNVPDYITNGTGFEASIPVPAVGERIGKLRFPNGVTVVRDKFPQRKKWLTLSHIDVAGARSAHRIRQSYGDVISSLPRNVVLETEIKNSRRVVQWNTWKNCLMVKSDVNYFYNKLMKFRSWPMEILMLPKTKEFTPKEKNSKSERKSKQATSGSFFHFDHFMVFLDLSPLLHPGVTRVRVAAPLLTYSYAELLHRYGAEFLTEFGFISQSQHSIPGNRRKGSSIRSKSSTREYEDHLEPSAVYVYNEFDSPTFIIVEIELSAALIQRRNLESLETDLRSHMCLKEKLKPKITTFGLLKENFAQCIMHMMSALTEEYNEYCSNDNTKEIDPNEINLEFQKHLTKKESFYRIKSTLERAVLDLIREKYGTVSQYEEKIPEIYVYLVNEMHRVTNSCMIEQNDYPNLKVYTDELQFYAEEATEEGDYDLAKDYLFLKLARNPQNPNYWLDCAVFFNRINKREEAIEAVREALGLEFYHQIGLLMYALLASKFMNPSIAETTFGILLTKYPNFVEGWLTLSLFYSLFSNFEGAQVALQEAIKLQSEKSEKVEEEEEEEAPEPTENQEHGFAWKVHECKMNDQQRHQAVKHGVGSFVNSVSCMEPLAWTINFVPPDNIYIKTTVLLQKLGFFEYASLSLAEELLTGTKEGKLSPQYIYYFCVNNYLQGRYEEAIPLLQKTVKEYGKDCYIWSIMGHCYYKLQNHAEAVSCYEYVKESFNRPNDIHLIYSRIGYYYLQVKKFSCAKQVFINGCKFSPSPKLWKGVGISCMELQELEEAEIAFSEANYLDNRDPETWAYLGLTNALLRRLDLFRQCYLEAKKRNLNNAELIRKIKYTIGMSGLEDSEF